VVVPRVPRLQSTVNRAHGASLCPCGASAVTSLRHTWLAEGSKNKRCGTALRAFNEQGNNGGNGKDSGLDEYIEVKVDSVRVSQGASVVYLRLLDGSSPPLVLPVHIGDAESSALLKEINKQKNMRPLTHDLTKNLLQAVGFRVTKIRITELVSSTFYSRIHIARLGSPDDDVDVDARPSDALNLAVRFNAPMYISKRIAEQATAHPSEAYSTQSESAAEIVRSCREALASFEDPTVMFQLQKELAIQEQRYEDAQTLQQQIFEHMTHSSLLRLVVAMEAALADGRYEEAARLRDEYRRMVASAPADYKRGP